MADRFLEGLQPNALPRTNAKQPFRSDAACFVAYADKPGMAPICECGKPAVGGVFQEFDSGYPMGQVTGTARFDCGCIGTEIYSISQFAGWDLFNKLGPGLYRVRKRTPQERIKEVTRENAPTY